MFCVRLLAVGEKVAKAKGPNEKIEQVLFTACSSGSRSYYRCYYVAILFALFPLALCASASSSPPQYIHLLLLLSPQACKELEEAIQFFRSIAAADEDLEQQQQQRGEDNSRQQQTAAASSPRSRGAKHGGGESSKKQQHSSSRRRKKEKGAAAPESAALAQDPLKALVSDWPPTDFPFDTSLFPGADICAAHQSSNDAWKTPAAEDPFAAAPSQAAAGAAVPADGAGDAPHSRVSSRRRNRSRGDSSSGLAPANASSSRSSSSSGNEESGSDSTRSRESRDSGKNQKYSKYRSRVHRRRAAAEAAAAATRQEAEAETEGDAASECCCSISVGSLHASFPLQSTNVTRFRLSIELSLPSYVRAKPHLGGCEYHWLLLLLLLLRRLFETQLLKLSRRCSQAGDLKLGWLRNTNYGAQSSAVQHFYCGVRRRKLRHWKKGALR